MRFHPAQHGEGFDAPPTLERSGSEHRRAVTSFLLRRKAWLEVELSLQERRRGRKVSTEGGYIPNPYGRDLGLGYRVRTLPQGFLSPTRGTERVVKTIEDRWGKYSTVGRFSPSPLRVIEFISLILEYRSF